MTDSPETLPGSPSGGAPGTGLPWGVDDIWDSGWLNGPPWFPSEPSLDGPDVAMLYAVEEAIAGLPERRAEVLRRRLGMTDEGAQTLQQIGDDFGVTRERIRQLEKSAISRLRGRFTRHARRLGSDENSARQTTCARLRSLRSADRGLLLMATFPEASPSVLDRVFSTIADVPTETILRWLENSEHRRSGSPRRQDSTRRSRFADRVRAAALGPRGAATEQWWPSAPARSVNDEGLVFNSSKLGRVVHAESKLELRALMRLEDSPVVTRFCEQPVRIGYRWFDGPRTYVPDIAVQFNDGACVLVEMKPRTLWADAMNLAKWNAAYRWCVTSGWTFVVLEESRDPTSALENSNNEGASILEQLSERGPVMMSELQHYWFGTGHTWAELIGTALRHGFAIQRQPMRVVRARHSPWLDALNQR